MININVHGLVDELGLWPGTQWLLAAFPAWSLPMVPALLTFGIWMAARLFIELRPAVLSGQYKAFWPGEGMLNVSLGALIAGLAFHASPIISPFWRSAFWNAATALVTVSVVIGLAVPEYVSAIRYRKRVVKPRHTYTLAQLHTPTCLAHRFSMAATTYLYMKVGVVALATAAVPVSFKLVAVAAAFGWFICLVFDNANGGRNRPANLDVVHPRRGGWFRIGGRTKAAPLPRRVDEGAETFSYGPPPGDNTIADVRIPRADRPGLKPDYVLGTDDDGTAPTPGYLPGTGDRKTTPKPGYLPGTGPSN